MATLADVQQEIARQLKRDYGDRPYDEVTAMLHFGLTEEAGEVAGLMKRLIRGFPKDKTRAVQETFKDELGDVLWYLTACCVSHGITLDQVWEHNIQKLKARYGE